METLSTILNLEFSLIFPTNLIFTIKTARGVFLLITLHQISDKLCLTILFYTVRLLVSELQSSLSHAY